MAILPLQYDIYADHIQLLRNCGFSELSPKFYCLYCGDSFERNELEKLSDEHVPQQSLGGKVVCVACTACNSTLGHTIDGQLTNFFRTQIFKAGLEGAEQEVRVGDHNFDGKLVNKAAGKDLVIDTNRVKPNLFEQYKDTIVDTVIIVKDRHRHQFKKLGVEAALIKNGYALLFGETGYNFLLRNHYQRIRDYLKNPTADFPRLYTHTIKQALPVGIYFVNEKDCNGFLISFELIERLTTNCVVFIPTPEYSFEEAAAFISDFKGGHQIFKLEGDFYRDPEHIKTLQKLVK